eukprot:TRINITY_DN17332_c0_g1_i2.p1 TRINITY_DN17332_c0_g1~~TRINITY_DN17332_c0_g1_i2.p1  ORF type:complete len:283 (-),score=60.91 TRINITY_DN17332_c0_g1_i2:211-1059(-)
MAELQLTRVPQRRAQRALLLVSLLAAVFSSTHAALDLAAFALGIVWAAAPRLQRMRPALRFFQNPFGYDGEKTEELEFVSKTCNILVANGPDQIRVLEWEPEDGRGTTYLYKSGKDAYKISSYYVAGRYFDPYETEIKQANFEGVGRKEEVPYKFLDYNAGKRLKLADNSVDVILMQPGTEWRLGNKAFRASFKESARVLKGGGMLLLFLEPEKDVPETAGNYFREFDFVEGKQVNCHQLAKRQSKEERITKSRSKSKKQKKQKDSISAKELGAVFDEIDGA